VEDTTRSNIKIPHPFFTELVDQATQYILSGEDIIKSDIPALNTELKRYFDDEFIAELSEVLTGGQAKGFENMYAYKNAEDRTAFMCADSMGVVEVRAKDTDENTEHVIYWYIDRIEKGQKKIKRIQVWDAKQIEYYVQVDNGEVVKDDSEPDNPKPHVQYIKDGKTYIKGDGGYGFIPFFRFDNNKKQVSSLKAIKPLIDDYDLMASSLSNNLADFDTPIHVVKGFQGDNLDELQTNLKTKKLIGVDDDGGVEVHTVDVPYQARVAKLELDEKNIYRFGMGLNTAGLKDTSATTNVAIKAAYSLLDLKCSKLIIQLKQFLLKLVKIVLDEVNETHGTDYQMKDVYFNFNPEIMSNAQENAQIELIEAQRKQAEITTLLNIAPHIDNETLMQLICEQLDIEYEEIKGKLPDPDEAKNAVTDAQNAIDGAVVVNE
jgi:SPP1 family phage portal protein